MRLGREQRTATPQTLKKNQRIGLFRFSRVLSRQKDDVGRIRTYAPEGTRFLVLRDNHSATTPMVVAVEQLL